MKFHPSVSIPYLSPIKYNAFIKYEASINLTTRSPKFSFGSNVVSRILPTFKTFGPWIYNRILIFKHMRLVFSHFLFAFPCSLPPMNGTSKISSLTRLLLSTICSFGSNIWTGCSVYVISSRSSKISYSSTWEGSDPSLVNMDTKKTLWIEDSWGGSAYR